MTCTALTWHRLSDKAPPQDTQLLVYWEGLYWEERISCLVAKYNAAEWIVGWDGYVLHAPPTHWAIITPPSMDAS